MLHDLNAMLLKFMEPSVCFRVKVPPNLTHLSSSWDVRYLFTFTLLWLSDLLAEREKNKSAPTPGALKQKYVVRSD